MAINSRQKGARGEREWAHYLTKKGYPARRGQQFSGSKDSPDVVCESLKGMHWEVKKVQALNLEAAYAQALRDCDIKVPIVAHRRDNSEWKVTLSAEHFFKILEQIPDLKKPDALQEPK